MKALGIDPGELTGVSLIEVSDTDRTILSAVGLGELKQRPAYELIHDYLDHKVDIAVIESWKPRGGAKTFKPFSLEIIGWVRGLCWEYGVPMVMQDPSVKDTWHAEAVQNWKEVGKGGGGHCRDSFAHLLGWNNARPLVKSK